MFPSVVFEVLVAAIDELFSNLFVVALVIAGGLLLLIVEILEETFLLASFAGEVSSLSSDSVVSKSVLGVVAPNIARLF